MCYLRASLKFFPPVLSISPPPCFLPQKPSGADDDAAQAAVWAGLSSVLDSQVQAADMMTKVLKVCFVIGDSRESTFRSVLTVQALNRPVIYTGGQGAKGLASSVGVDESLPDAAARCRCSTERDAGLCCFPCLQLQFTKHFNFFKRKKEEH